MTKKQKKVLFRIILAALLVIPSFFVPVDGIARLVLALIPYAVIGYDILIDAVRGVINRQPFDENFLMATATIGALALGEYLEGVAVMLFYQTGELFQSIAVGKSRKSIAELTDICPDYANVERDGKTERVSPEELEIGSTIIVKPGERVPVDGTVIDGGSTLDTSALTGESLPRTISDGDEVMSGCINLTGVLRVRVTREAENSTAAKILDLIENATSKKSRSENFISKFARCYTPIVCFLALMLCVVPPLVRFTVLGLPHDFSVWFYRALTFLVISCPCALVISIPLTFFAGIGGASREGILVKGSNYIETLARVKTVAFDKTGTLTGGIFKVVSIHGNDKELVLRTAALCESFSNHPIAKSITDAYNKGLDTHSVSDVREESGHGIRAVVDGFRVAVGNRRFMEKLGTDIPDGESEATTVYVARDNEYIGHINISDVPKEDAPAAISALQKLGISKTVMLTGDSANVAQMTAQKLGIDTVYAELLPEDKVALCEKLLPDGTLAYVGDGINDAPVLARSDVGIAMGALGSDAAIEAADVVLCDDNPKKVSQAIRTAKKCMRIVYQNIYFAIGIKVLCLLLGAFGFANMWFAIFADVGVMVLAVLNAMRAIRA